MFFCSFWVWNPRLVLECHLEMCSPAPASWSLDHGGHSQSLWRHTGASKAAGEKTRHAAAFLLHNNSLWFWVVPVTFGRILFCFVGKYCVHILPVFVQFFYKRTLDNIGRIQSCFPDEFTGDGDGREMYSENCRGHHPLHNTLMD